jgi:hypothetical protein
MPVSLLWTPKARTEMKSTDIALATEQPQSGERSVLQM